jgi:multidrug efflux pump subunit AcrB
VPPIWALPRPTSPKPRASPPAGDFVQRLSKLNLPDRQIPIRVGFAKSALASESLIGQLRVPGKRAGAAVSGGRDPRWTAARRRSIAYQRQRNVTLTAEFNGRPLGDVMKKSSVAES